MSKLKPLVVALILTLLMGGCQDNEAKSDDFNIETAKIGVMTGATGEMYTRSAYPDAEISDFSNVMDAVAALKVGRIDAVITADVTCRNIERENPDLERLPALLTDEHIGAGVKKGNEALLDGINSVIASLKEDGTLSDMESRWIESDPPLSVKIPEASGGDVLRVGTDATRVPFTYTNSDGSIDGFAPELARRIGLALGMRVEFVSMEFSALIPALESGKIDCIIDLMTATEERKQSINFSDDYYISGQNILKKREAAGVVEYITPQTYNAEDFIGKDIAIVVGTSYDTHFEAHIGLANFMYFNSPTECVEAVKLGKVFATMLDEPIARNYAAKNPGIVALYPVVTPDTFAIAFRQDSDALREEMNAFLAEIQANGVYDDMITRWVDTAEPPPMREFNLTGERGTLRYQTSGGNPPFSYLQNGIYAGFDAEFANLFAEWAGYKLETVIADAGSRIPALQSGKVDFVADLMTVTPERSLQVDFSDPYYIGGVCMIVFDGSEASAENVTFWESLKKSFTQNLIVENRWKLIADGLCISLIITLFAFTLATVLGFGVCGLRMSKNPVLNAIGSIYVTILRGTPIVVLLMITFYIIFAKSNISGTIVAIIAFGANGAAFVGEIIRSAILTVDKGQIEAARSMGFSKASAFFTVTFPQAVRVAFPVYKSEFISMFKMTSVVGYIAIADLTKAGDIIRSRTYDAFFPLIMVAVVYLIAASLMIFLFDRIDSATDKRRNRR